MCKCKYVSIRARPLHGERIGGEFGGKNIESGETRKLKKNRRMRVTNEEADQDLHFWGAGDWGMHERFWGTNLHHEASCGTNLGPSREAADETKLYKSCRS